VSAPADHPQHPPDSRGVPLTRIAWLTTVVICLVTCVILLLSGYLGYAGVLLAVALSAAINLR
jgi:ABC-type Fe3+-siderophore transport system permease subunit